VGIERSGAAADQRCVPRIFLCDDTAEYRALVRTVLNAESDLEVVGEACSGRECIDDAPALHPDVVLLDLNMPGMHGFEALPLVREAAPEAQVVILTTDDKPEAADTAQRLGATALIRKPRNVFDLPGCVRESVPALDRRRTPRVA
jgi:DNA-binding NarL/FixJ family response regulator